MKVAYLGPPDTFTHLAAMQAFGKRVAYCPAHSVDDVFSYVETGATDVGVVPIENSIEGSVTHTLDIFPHARAVICGEIVLPVHHALASRSRSLRSITTIFSHPQAFGQCRRWLTQHLARAERWETRSTAEAVELAARPGRIRVPVTHRAAIATPAAAKRHQLHILAESIEDHRHNVTRFLVIGRESPRTSSRRHKTSLLFALKDRPGALHDALLPFKRQRINLTKIESRPSKMRAWEYVFFVDLEGRADDPRVARALASLKHHCTVFRLLGSYPMATRSPRRPT